MQVHHHLQWKRKAQHTAEANLLLQETRFSAFVTKKKRREERRQIITRNPSLRPATHALRRRHNNRQERIHQQPPCHTSFISEMAFPTPSHKLTRGCTPESTHLSVFEIAFPMATGCASNSLSYKAILLSNCRNPTAITCSGYWVWVGGGNSTGARVPWAEDRFRNLNRHNKTKRLCTEDDLIVPLPYAQRYQPPV